MVRWYHRRLYPRSTLYLSPRFWRPASLDHAFARAAVEYTVWKNWEPFVDGLIVSKRRAVMVMARANAKRKELVRLLECAQFIRDDPDWLWIGDRAIVPAVIWCAPPRPLLILARWVGVEVALYQPKPTLQTATKTATSRAAASGDIP
jgi:hypothetical protein